MAEAFGFNERPRVPDAKASTIPRPRDLKDSLAVGASAIGQDRDLATPLQMAVVGATIAERGRRARPRIVRNDKVLRRRVVSARVAGQVREMMLGVVRSGTGTAAAIPGVQVAGKTGTAELRPNSTNPKDADAWFVAFAPASKPTVAVAVMLVGAGFGGNRGAHRARRCCKRRCSRARSAAAAHARDIAPSIAQPSTVCPHQHMNGAVPVHPFLRRFSLTDGVVIDGWKRRRARGFASECLVTWAVKPSASLADLATIDLRRIADVLQVDHASLYLRDPDDPQRAAVVAETGLPVGEALPEHRMLLSGVLQSGCAAEIHVPAARTSPAARHSRLRSLHEDGAVGAVLVVTRRASRRLGAIDAQVIQRATRVLVDRFLTAGGHGDHRQSRVESDRFVRDAPASRR